MNTIIDNIKCGDIKKSKVHGFGLFATRTVEINEVLCYLDGQYIDWKIYDSLLIKSPELVQIFIEWNAISESLLLLRPFRTKYSYINHSRIPNVAVKHNPIRLVALRQIKINEEFLLDYRAEPLRKEYIEGHGKTYL